MNTLSKILSSKIRADIFRLLFGLNNIELHMRDIERRSGFAIGTIQSELRNLAGLDLIVKRRDGNRVYLRANTSHPLYLDIRNIVLKTSGLVDVIKQAFGEESSILSAFIYGSIATGSEKASSDLDLMVIGKIGLRKLSKLLSNVSEIVGREINPHILEPEILQKRLGENDHFINQVMQSPKLFIVGNEHDLKIMVG